jgi:hypothetical protein
MSKIVPGTEVVLQGSEAVEYGVVTHLYEAEPIGSGTWRVWVAFHGDTPRSGMKVVSKPYMENHYIGSLLSLEDYDDLSKRQAQYENRSWRFWPMSELIRRGVETKQKEWLQFVVEDILQFDDHENLVGVFLKFSGLTRNQTHQLFVELDINF